MPLRSILYLFAIAAGSTTKSRTRGHRLLVIMMKGKVYYENTGAQSACPREDLRLECIPLNCGTFVLSTCVDSLPPTLWGQSRPVYFLCRPWLSCRREGVGRTKKYKLALTVWLPPNKLLDCCGRVPCPCSPTSSLVARSADTCWLMIVPPCARNRPRSRRRERDHKRFVSARAESGRITFLQSVMKWPYLMVNVLYIDSLMVYRVVFKSIPFASLFTRTPGQKK